MLKTILLSTVMLLLVAGLTYSQTAEQKSGIINKVTSEKQIPQYLLDQLESAQRTENVAEENRIMNILNSEYLEVTFHNSTESYNAIATDGSDVGAYSPPYNPDWVNPDRLVYDHAGLSPNYTDRTLDMKYCEENGKLYIAACVNITGFHGVRVYSSSNSGLTWIFEGGLSNNATYWTGLSMTVEQRNNSVPDSVRVHVFYTEAAATNNDGARLGYWSFKPDGTAYHIFKVIGTPAAGNEFRWPSAYSNGQFQSSSTDIGCIVGEYNNAGTTCISMRQFYMVNFSWTFSITTNNTGWNEFRPSAVYKNNPSGTDSVYIATERRFTSPATYKIRLLRTRYYGGVSSPAWNYTEITPGSTGYDHNPCLAIQDLYSPLRMVITYTQNTSSSSQTGYGRRSYSYSGGAVGSWTHAALGNSATTYYTWVSVDTNGSSTYCAYLWGDSDSLNISFSNIAATVNIAYDLASNSVTGTCSPVSVVYNNSSGNFRRPGFTYWANGPQDIYYDGENLPTGITNTNEIAKSYSLSQNFPNPFNPTTTIKFSLPKDGLVKLVVYDVLGKEVATLLNDEKTKGTYEVTYDATKLNSGVYFYKITSGDFSDVKKMLLVK